MSATHPFLQELFASVRRHVATLGLFSICVNLLMLVTPIYLLQIYDRVLPSRNTDTLGFLTAIVITALLTMTLLDAIRGLILIKFGAWFDRQVSEHLLSGSLARSLRNQRSPSSNVFNDLAQIRSFVSGSNLIPILDAPWAPIFIGILFLLHPTIGWIALGGAVLLIVLAPITQWITGYHVRKAQQAAEDTHRSTGAILDNAGAVEAMGMRSDVIRQWSTMNEGALAAHQAAGVRSVWLGALSKLIRHVLQIAVVGVAAWLVLNNELTAGALIASLLLLRRALAPFERAIPSWKMIVAARESYDRINERLKAAPMVRPRQALPPPKGRIKFDNVSFTYRRQKHRTLRDISFRIPAGSVVGLVGGMATGKSTLAKVMVGLLKPGSGAVFWGRHKLDAWDPQDLGPYIGYLPQDIELLPGTIAQNIARMQPAPTGDIVAAARLAGIDDMIETLPYGYDTAIGRDGADFLSGGQRQLVALARAVFGDVRLVVLDEPQAHLDEEGRRILSETIQRLREREVTVVVIGHKINELPPVDQHLVIDDGRVKMSTVSGGKEGRGRRERADRQDT